MSKKIEIRVVRDNTYAIIPQRNRIVYDIVHYIEVEDELERITDRSGCLISFEVLPTTTWGDMLAACVADATAHNWLP